MDNSTQVVFNLIVAVAGFFGAFILQQIMAKLAKHDERLDVLPDTFVRRDDYRADMLEIKTMLHKINDKLDAKQDKHYP